MVRMIPDHWRIVFVYYAVPVEVGNNRGARRREIASRKNHASWLPRSRIDSRSFTAFQLPEMREEMALTVLSNFPIVFFMVSSILVLTICFSFLRHHNCRLEGDSCVSDTWDCLSHHHFQETDQQLSASQHICPEPSSGTTPPLLGRCRCPPSLPARLLPNPLRPTNRIL